MYGPSMKALPALLAVLLALAPAAGGAHGALPLASDGPSLPQDAAVEASGRIVPGAGTTGPAMAGSSETDGTSVSNRSIHVLDVSDGELERSAIGHQSLDLGPAMSFSTNETTWRLETEAMVERVRSVESTNRRQRLILGALNDIEQRIITLRGRQRDAVAAYGAGEIGAKRLLIRLIRVDAEARALEVRRQHVVALAEDTEQFALDSSRRAKLRIDLMPYTGPVRKHAREVLQGEKPPTRFYVASGDGAVVLSTIDNDTYIREAFRGSLRQQRPRSITTQDALNITAESYPVIFRVSKNDTEVLGSDSSYRVNIPHQKGTLSAFVDSGSKRVFKESQTRPLGVMEHEPPVSEVRDGLRLQVNQTYPGAPLHIRLTDVETGVPVGANVTVGLEGRESDFVGTTGADGGVWTLTPRGRFTVTAIKGNSVVFVTLQPAEIPRVNAPANRSQTLVAPADSIAPPRPVRPVGAAPYPVDL
jgi:hypothetical protein